MPSARFAGRTPGGGVTRSWHPDSTHPANPDAPENELRLRLRVSPNDPVARAEAIAAYCEQRPGVGEAEIALFAAEHSLPSL